MGLVVQVVPLQLGLVGLGLAGHQALAGRRQLLEPEVLLALAEAVTHPLASVGMMLVGEQGAL